VEHVAFDLFAEQGFDNTTVDDLAHAAGIGRRTFFRYFRSKSDVVWGAFDEQLDSMREHLAGFRPDLPVLDAVREALVAFNRVEPAEVPWHRRRMELILRVPALQANATLRYAKWRAILADFVAGRVNEPVDSLVPQTIAYVALGVAMAAYEQWLTRPDADNVALRALLATAMQELVIICKKTAPIP
jgi:mycofactocin system transcriptional regulator